ncbi:hypothetical protein H6G81_11965 [Scytonema hofmannii FACHB-248]|uniref:Uncharacterized protein n=2 Tax=Nostocales TaxID=1161 RepID=A0ABR8GQ16_9CYAN|nr:hypothetical protein [Scytonema hofmannii]MBD2605230.1 hypothetical protein [Scytonema hofmannii FACHB-248]
MPVIIRFFPCPMPNSSNPPGDSHQICTQIGGETPVATSRQSRPTRWLRNGGGITKRSLNAFERMRKQ